MSTTSSSPLTTLARVTTKISARVLTAFTVLLTMAACGPSAPADESPDKAATADAVDSAESPGENLLSDQRWGGQADGDTVSASWRFPASYEPAGDGAVTNEAVSTSDEGDYVLQIGSYAGRDNWRDFADQIEGSMREEGQEDIARSEISIDGGDYIELVSGEGGASQRFFLHDPGEGNYWYLFYLAAPVPVADVPQKRLTETYQFIASLELEPL